MNCRLIKNIKHSCDYNPGGIKEIYLLDIRDFVNYTFRNDRLYDECFVENIRVSDDYRELSTVQESIFTETQENDIFRQQLITFVRSSEAEKLGSLLITKKNKFLVTFKTNQGRAFSFGSDGGATLSFSQTTGQLGETGGYSITITKDSIYPLFEVSLDAYNKRPVWILENGVWNDNGVWLRNGIWKTI